MTYPQPSANEAVVDGRDSFRLLTQLVSPGDIYQSEQSGFAFALGPQSDLSRINVDYFDNNVAGSMQRVVLGTRTPYTGIIQARNETTYEAATNAGRPPVPGHILFSPANLVPKIVQSASQQVFAPVLDVIQYLQPPSGTLPQVRNDKDYFFNDFPTAGGAYSIFLPFYGRVFADIRFNTSAGGESARIRGYNYYSSSGAIITTLMAATALAGGPLQKLVRAPVDGFFDYIELTVSGGTGLAIQTFVRFSDIPQ